jgi:hypothetical protein
MCPLRHTRVSRRKKTGMVTSQSYKRKSKAAMALLSLVYVSSATVELPFSELLRILEKSRVENARLGVTGMLLYKGGNVIQALEGAAEDVQSLYQRIQSDKRHKDVTTLWRQPVEKRQFGNWSMGFRAVEELPPETLDSYSQFLFRPDLARAFAENRHVAYQLLSSFREHMR